MTPCYDTASKAGAYSTYSASIDATKDARGFLEERNLQAFLDNVTVCAGRAKLGESQRLEFSLATGAVLVIDHHGSQQKQGLRGVSVKGNRSYPPDGENYPRVKPVIELVPPGFR
ncbi:hypothetical protein PoB_002436200 [Plakobranchus ocellatus]|uniref:Uncharacterized protein n=1 Tax=Plakobranchus ocellatus TaxID=259542 RepID=A0AAV3ZT78_9GAST|nr:hypothetical protein PoB_002436200 [Plakobranchus ocellatus]